MVFGERSTAEEVSEGHNLEGKVVIVTGASSGLGKECTRVFFLRGATVILGVRNVPKGEEAAEEIFSSLSSSHPSLKRENLKVLALDLGSFQSVRTFAAEFEKLNLPRLDILLNNGAIMVPPFELLEGYESQFTTNHLGHFLLTSLLVPHLVKTAQLNKEKGLEGQVRVVNVSSVGHRISPVNFDDINFQNGAAYDKWKAYGQAKTANALFAKELNRRLSPHGVESFSLHPGGIMTGLQTSLQKEEMMKFGWIDEQGNINARFKDIPQGSSTSMYACLSSDLTGKGGNYLENCKITEEVEVMTPVGGLKAWATDLDAAAKLWDLSEKITQITSKF